MSNPAGTRQSWALNTPFDVKSADNPDQFYGYGSMFMNQSQFVLDISEKVHLFGADATPFFSWSSMVRKSPAKGIDFSWMEDEIFSHRDITAKIRRYCPAGGTTNQNIYTLKVLNGGDWQAFEAAPLADALAQAQLTADPTKPVVYCRIKVGSNEVWFLPLARGLALGPTTRSYAPVLGTAYNLLGEMVLVDNSNNSNRVGGNVVYTASPESVDIMSHHATGGTAAGQTLTQAVMNTLLGNTDSMTIGTATEFACTVRTFTPNEIHKGFAQGSGLPTETRKRSRTLKNYVQIFKTPYSIANTLKVVRTYGGDELAKLRYRKAIQHKVDIERAILFQGGGTENGSGATGWGYVGGNTQENPLTRFKGLGVGITSRDSAGFIATKNGGWDADFRLKADGSSTPAEMNALVGRIFDDTIDSPSSSKLVFASKKWMGALSAMAMTQSSGQFVWGVYGQKDGRLGIKIRTLETPFGDLNFVDMPHFRGEFEDYALVCDMNNIEIKPLRDTTLVANCGDLSVDGQLDYYITELGFECRHESTHAVLKLA